MKSCDFLFLFYVLFNIGTLSEEEKKTQPRPWRSRTRTTQKKNERKKEILLEKKRKTRQRTTAAFGGDGVGSATFLAKLHVIKVNNVSYDHKKKRRTHRRTSPGARPTDYCEYYLPLLLLSQSVAKRVARRKQELEEIYLMIYLSPSGYFLRKSIRILRNARRRRRRRRLRSPSRQLIPTYF